MVDAFLLVVGLAGLADVDRASVGERKSGGDEAVGAEQAADRLPFARVIVLLEALADPAQEVVGEHADKDVAVDAVLELMEIRPQSEGAFELAEASFGLEERHVEFPELGGFEAFVGLQNIVAALSDGVFHFVLVAGDFESPGVVFERVKPRCAGVAFLEGSDFAFDDGRAFEDAFFDALAEGGGGGEEALLGTRNHCLLLEAALGASAQDQVARGVLGVGDFFNLHALVVGASRQSLEGLFFKRVGILGAAAACDVDEVGIPALLEQGEVRARGKPGVEDDHGLEALLVAGEAIENNGQGFGVAHVTLEGLVGERETVFVKGDADGDLTAVVAVLLVFSVFGFWVGGAESLEMAIGDVVENDATAEREKITFALAQGGLDVLSQGHEIVAGAVEAVLGAFGDADVEEFGKGGAAGPIDQGPFAQRLDEAVGNHELRCGNGAGVHAKGFEHGSEMQLFPGFEGDEFGAELDDIGGFDGVEDNAIHSGLGNRLGSLRSACELDNAIHPSACFLGEGGVKEIALAMDAALDRAGNESFFGLWDSGIAKGGDDLLAREPFAIAIGMNELNEPRAADDFCSKKHLLKRIAKKNSPVNKKRKN